MWTNVSWVSKSSVEALLGTAVEVAAQFKAESELYILGHWRSLLLLLTVYLFASFILYISSLRSASDCFGGAVRVMLVTAHPDDEAMFFGPTLLKLADSAKVFLLCLSPGDYYGKGEERKKELYEACRVLGIPDQNIVLLKYTDLPDDPYASWSEPLVAELVSRYAYTLQIDTIISFDQNGVSYHENHTSIGCCLSTIDLPSGVVVYALETVNIVRKYSLFFDVLFSRVICKNVVTVPLEGHYRIVYAMACHISQYVWYRRLFIHFSRYAYINTFRRIESSPR